MIQVEKRGLRDRQRTDSSLDRASSIGGHHCLAQTPKAADRERAKRMERRFGNKWFCVSQWETLMENERRRESAAPFRQTYLTARIPAPRGFPLGFLSETSMGGRTVSTVAWMPPNPLLQPSGRQCTRPRKRSEEFICPFVQTVAEQG